jgi:tetratricopeptide (TPR) repeat protein
MRELPNSAEGNVLLALVDRRQGNCEKAIQELRKASELDPRNPYAMLILAETLTDMRQYRASEQAYDRLIELVPNSPMIKVEKELCVTFFRTGNYTTALSALAALPTSMADDRRALTLRLNFVLIDQNWVQANRLLEQLKGRQAEFLAYVNVQVPIGCYSLLLARLQGKSPGIDSSFADTRELLYQKTLAHPGNAPLLSALAVLDALLARKEDAINEAKSAVERVPISQDAIDGRSVLANLGAVYAWTNEPDLAFENLRF